MDFETPSKIKIVGKIVSKIISFFIATYLCYLLYDYFLKDLFKLEITFSKWILIKILFHLLLPNTIDSIKNDKQRA